MTDYARIDLSRLRTLSLAQRPSKVRARALPKILFGEDQCPTGVGGRGFTLNGRHGLLIPLLAFAVVDALGG